MSAFVVNKHKYEVTLPLTGRVARWDSRKVDVNVMSKACFAHFSAVTSCVVIAIDTVTLDGELQSAQDWCKEEWNDVGPILNIIYDWYLTTNRRVKA